jgi:uncharacterized protein YlxP (DUF503 family)
MYKFVGSYNDLVLSITLNSERKNVSTKESLERFLDLIDFESFLSILEKENKTVENLLVDIKNLKEKRGMLKQY